jgi:branched-chain amino acid transport system ATP-binding protein
MLITKNLRKFFGGIKAVNDVSVSFNRGKINLIIGPNGSGKTTLVNLLTGFYKPDSGKILYDPSGSNTYVDITNLPPEDRVKLGITRSFQIPSPFMRLTVLENMLVAYQNNPGENFYKALFKKTWIKQEHSATEKAFRILKILSLDHLWDEYAVNLSGGQLKLLELGRALMTDPKLLVLDEPIGSVNPRIAEEILSKIIDLRDKLHITSIIVEHRLDLILDYADYLYVMHEGKIILEGDPKKVINYPIVSEIYLGEASVR